MKDIDLFKNIDVNTAYKLQFFLDKITEFLVKYSKDEDIVALLKRFKRYPSYYKKAIYPCYSGDNLDEHINKYVYVRIYNELLCSFMISYKTIFEFVPKEISNNYNKLKNDLLTFDKRKSLFSTYYEFRHVLDEYSTYKEIIKKVAKGLIERATDLYSSEIDSYLAPYYKLKYYNKFEEKYNNIVSDGKEEIGAFINSDAFLSCGIDNADLSLRTILDNYKAKIEELDQKIQSFIDYTNQRLLRLKNVAPKNISDMEQYLYEKLLASIDKIEFDLIYTTVYSMFIDRRNIDKAYKDNLKTKRILNIIKRKIDIKYVTCTDSINDEILIACNIKAYLDHVLGRVISEESISFNFDVISQLKFNDMEHDLKLINEAINGNDIISSNNIYLINLNIMSLHREFSYPLVELTFNKHNVGVNEITNQSKMNGETQLNYPTFIYQYISLDTFAKNAIYINKKFIKNDYYSDSLQDFSNSTLLLNYNGLLLIETNGEYEVVSHEMITMAGYDIPEPDKIKANKIESNKKEILNNIINIAKSLRDEKSPLNMVNVMKPIKMKMN